MNDKQEFIRAKIRVLRDITAWMLANNFEPAEIAWFFNSWLDELDD